MERTDEGATDAGGAAEDDDAGEVRYRLTPLGERVLDDRGTFAGFGPCAVAWRAGEFEPRREVPRARRVRRRTSAPERSLFG